MQIPVITGIYADTAADFRVAYPRNMVPVPKSTGISEGYLRPSDGIVAFGAGVGPGIDRGGINWNGTCYRVMGQWLVKIASDGTVTTLGDVQATAQVSMDYSFDRLVISSGGKLWYYNGAVLSQVVDPTLGTSLDSVFLDGYYLSTDGTDFVATVINNPMAVMVNYGSSEKDPDSIKALKVVRGELHVINRHSIELFQNVGGDGISFPFQVIDGGYVTRGAVGTHAVTVMEDALAFVGGGRGEPCAVWIASGGQSSRVSTPEIDRILLGYTEAQLALAVVETRLDQGRHALYVHLSDQTLVYDVASSKAIGAPVWYRLTTSIVGAGQYRARNFVYAYDKWLCGDPTSTAHGYLSNTVSTHYGTVIGWDFSTAIIYGEGRNAIMHGLELVCLTGNVALGLDPIIWTSYSLDGELWSTEHSRRVGALGERAKRVLWAQQGPISHWRIQRFRGTSDAHISVARLEATIEPLAV